MRIERTTSSAAKMKACAASLWVSGPMKATPAQAHAVEELGGSDLGAPHRRLRRRRAAR